MPAAALVRRPAPDPLRPPRAPPRSARPGGGRARWGRSPRPVCRPAPRKYVRSDSLESRPPRLLESTRHRAAPTTLQYRRSVETPVGLDHGRRQPGSEAMGDVASHSAIAAASMGRPSPRGPGRSRESRGPKARCAHLHGQSGHPSRPTSGGFESEGQPPSPRVSPALPLRRAAPDPTPAVGWKPTALAEPSDPAGVNVAPDPGGVSSGVVLERPQEQRSNVGYQPIEASGRDHLERPVDHNRHGRLRDPLPRGRWPVSLRPVPDRRRVQRRSRRPSHSLARPHCRRAVPLRGGSRWPVLLSVSASGDMTTLEPGRAPTTIWGVDLT